jgi:hypothetical protein
MIVDVIVSISGFLGFHGKLSILDSLLKNKTSRQKATAFIPPPEGGGSSRGAFMDDIQVKRQHLPVNILGVPYHCGSAGDKPDYSLLGGDYVFDYGHFLHLPQHYSTPASLEKQYALRLTPD